MKNKILALLSTLYFATNIAFNQENEILMPYLKGNLYGFANAKGEIIVEPKYDYVSLFENGFARIKLDKKWGLLNQSGQVIFETTAKSISTFDSNGLAIVQAYNKYGVINQLGEWVAPLEYYWAGTNYNYIQVKNSIGQTALLDSKGKTIVDFKFERFVFQENLSVNANRIIVLQKDKSGLILIRDGKYKLSIEPQYESLTILNDQYIIAKKNGKFGLIDYKKNTIIPFEYDGFERDSNFIILRQKVEYVAKLKTIEIEHEEYQRPRRLSRVEKEYDDKNKIVYYLMTQKEQNRMAAYGVDLNEEPHLRVLYSLINSRGQMIIPAQFDRIKVGKNNLIQVRSDEGIIRLFDSNGTQITPVLFKQIDDLKEGLILAKVPYNKGFVIETDENDVESEGAVNNDQFRFGFIDTTGKTLIPFLYSGAFAFNKGLAPVKQDKWALINKKGDLITEYKYDQLYYAGDNRYAFKQGLRWGLLDLNGREVIPAKYYGDKTNEYSTDHFGGYSGLVFKNGKAKTTKELPGFMQKRMTLIDTNGIQLLPFKYQDIKELEGGFYRVSLRNPDRDSDHYGLVDKKGMKLYRFIKAAFGGCLTKKYMWFRSRPTKIFSPIITNQDKK